ncbi:calcium-binding protein [Microcoleus sp. LEGE 07076]|uniref:calcium-binding protein n=1 Tax=Microcoleus sp. LEGE 07076 TaxID=915322 RepID=UPI0018829876|nr:calcium-binding protein [Microcoleus sp. LEGE 07076]MBE9183675.1 calcium-binding protein [Microcoleus sp. LEGE 07076]
MALQSNVENGISRLLGDNTSEFITLSPGQLTNIPGGAWVLGGNDTVIGSADSELILGNDGQDSISGGAGNDTLIGGKDSDFVDGGIDNDLVRGDLDADTVRGGDGNDSLFGGRGTDQLFGDAGDDFLSGDRDRDTLTGGEGSDIFALAIGGGLDIITDFGNGSDFIQVPAGVSISDILIESSSAFTLLSLRSTGEPLAQLNNVPASSITTGRLLLPNQQRLESPPGPINIPQPPSELPIPLLPDVPLPPIPF